MLLLCVRVHEQTHAISSPPGFSPATGDVKHQFATRLEISGGLCLCSILQHVPAPLSATDERDVHVGVEQTELGDVGNRESILLSETDVLETARDRQGALRVPS